MPDRMPAKAFVAGIAAIAIATFIPRPKPITSSKISGIQGTLDLPERPCSGVHPMATLPTSASVGPRARHLLAVDIPAAASGGAQWLKLSVEGLPIGADAGIADEAFFGVIFGHILRQP